MLERTAFYTVSGTFVLYLTRGLGYDNAAADTQLGLWNGACYVCPLLGG
jgi:dipeptide/tripeptide permease